MRVTAMSVRLPNLNVCSLHRFPFEIEKPAHQMNDSAFRRPFVTANGCEVSILFHRSDQWIKWAEDIFRCGRRRGIIGEKGRMDCASAVPARTKLSCKALRRVMSGSLEFISCSTRFASDACYCIL